MSAGKFTNPIFRVGQLIFDDDLAPEGFNEAFSLLPAPVGNLDDVKVHVLQWTFNEIANKQDGWMFGGQIKPTLHIGSLQLQAGLGQYSWLNPDRSAQALSKNTTAFAATGAPVTNSNFNSALINTNLLVTKTIQPPTPKGGKKPATFQAITGYQSGFNQSNVTFAATLPNVLGTQPLQAYADYVYNWDAATDEAHGAMAGLRLGQTKTRGDFAIGGYYEYL